MEDEEIFDLTNVRAWIIHPFSALNFFFISIKRVLAERISCGILTPPLQIPRVYKGGVNYCILKE